MDRFDIEQRAPEKDRMMLGASAPYVAYRYALNLGWITQAEHDAGARALRTALELRWRLAVEQPSTGMPL